jgi:ABC-type transporter Mla subunit MlaD
MCLFLSKIKLDLLELQAALDSLQTSIDDFTSYTTTFASNTRDQLTSFNSDFIEKVDALLDNTNDDINTNLLKKLKLIHEAGEKLSVDMKTTDEEISQIIKSGSS